MVKANRAGLSAARRYRPETAGRLAARRVPLVRPDETVADARRAIREGTFDETDLVAVVDRDGRYVGVTPLRRLIEAEGDVAMRSIAVADWPAVDPSMDQEHAIAVAGTAAAMAIPVVDKGELVGVLSSKTMFNVLRAEHREDLQRLAGILREGSGARHSLEDPPSRQFARRIPWLLVGLMLSSLATALMAGFQEALETTIIVAFFIPALVYLTDAIGTQTVAASVRELSLRRPALGGVLWRQLATGGMIGSALGLVSFIAIWLIFGDARIGLGVAISLVAAGTLASGIGLSLPWLLSRFGLDPAFGAGPVGTILQDVLTIAIYFFVVTQIVGVG